MRSGITGERQDIMKEVIHEMFSEEQVQNKIVEIAEKLNLPLGTVKSRIFFTRQKLQEELKDFR